MTRLSNIFLLWVAAFLFSSHLFAAEIAAPGTPARKLQRGFLNVALSPIEISTELQKEKKKDTFPPSWFVGLGRGSLFMAGRALTGLYEMATFWLSKPEGFEPILEPEFPWEHFSK